MAKCVYCNREAAAGVDHQPKCERCKDTLAASSRHGLIEKFESLRAQSQKLLIELLTADVGIAFTFLEIAKTTGDPDHSRSALGNARTALASIRHLGQRIDNAAEWQRIGARTNELEQALESYGKPKSEKAATPSREPRL